MDLNSFIFYSSKTIWSPNLTILDPNLVIFYLDWTNFYPNLIILSPNSIIFSPNFNILQHNSHFGLPLDCLQSIIDHFHPKLSNLRSQLGHLKTKLIVLYRYWAIFEPQLDHGVILVTVEKILWPCRDKNNETRRFRG